MDLNAWFEKGLTADEYIQSMNRNKQEMLSILNQFSLRDADKHQLEQLRPRKLRAIVLTEDWCGDAMLNNPILLKIAETAEIDVRFILRDQNLELMDQYLTNGTSRAIPIFIFINQDGVEVGVWGPRAPEIQARVDKERAALPDNDSPDFQEKQMAMYKRLSASYQTDPAIWQTVADSIISLLLK
ncbi:thioredoxin family protein [Neobacillus fumarioli]|uniref:thioredoxin family protein n=1 Tax=Neobacillus fumarioli TaxID=105229 RepID=UPI0008352ACA|nr:thioredoxin family protein [Neobacillus fumarioli]